MIFLSCCSKLHLLLCPLEPEACLISKISDLRCCVPGLLEDKLCPSFVHLIKTHLPKASISRISFVSFAYLKTHSFISKQGLIKDIWLPKLCKPEWSFTWVRNKSTYFRDTIDFIFRHTVETDIATCTYPRMFTHHFLWINPHGYRHQSGGWRNKNSWWIWIMMPVYRNQNHPQAKRDSHIVHFDQVHSLLWSGRRAAGPSCNCIVHRSSCSFLSQHPATSMMRPGPRMACLHHYISRLILIVRPQSFPDSQDCLVDRHIVCVLWSFFLFAWLWSTQMSLSCFKSLVVAVP